MAAHRSAQKSDIGPDAAPVRRRMRPRAMRATDVAHESPAAALQAQLAQSWAEGPAVEAKWSARRSLALVVLVNGAFWVGLGVAVTSFLRSVP